MMEYRNITSGELVPALFEGFRRYQVITHCWSKENGQWRLVPEPRTIENWDQSQREFICHCLEEILASGGMVAGAFETGQLVGIVSVEAEPLGSRNQYLAVAFLHVSQQLRGSGIGRTLFSMAKKFAAERGVEKLYISSQPSEETQAFYRAVGCVEAEEYNADYIVHNPKECQLECWI